MTPEQQISALQEMLQLDENGNPPELCHDLQECVCEDADPFPMLAHPFVHTIYFPVEAGRYNKMYEQKLKALARYEHDGNWSGIIFGIVERPYRAEYLWIYRNRMGDEQFWSLAGHVWIDSENIYQHLAAWEGIFADDRPGRESMMDEEERDALANLPDTITVYRGTAAVDQFGSGFSWTLDRKRAEWFGRRFAGVGDNRDKPWLIQGEIEKSKVIAHFLGRGEQEIVAWPHDVQITKKRRIT